ncbi:carboxynorspermidine decarboxylase [Candidatus Uhrbacteria bacterium]|nr:carboxynorspermidine decarboxylase [Candidatus Uhrbacteria bacterium]
MVPYLREESPCTVVNLEVLQENLGILEKVQAQAGCKVLVALKAFAMWDTFPLMAQYLSGAAVSSPDEARLAYEMMGKEVHAYAPAYSQKDMREMVEMCDHITFNSFSQWREFRTMMTASQKRIGIRINPEHSEAEVDLYNPCARGSRLGVTLAQFKEEELGEVSGLHFHTLCEQGAEPLVRTLAAVEEKFGRWFPRLIWINMGGGHHITKPGYNRRLLVQTILDFKKRTGLEVILEPGEAVAIGTGVLVSTVLDIVENDGLIAMLDTSATAHMPDTLEMPYRPEVYGARKPGELPFSYRLGGLTCLAGDMIGARGDRGYSFNKPLNVGDKIVFLDMSHYTTVKTTTFNGVRLPSLATWWPDPAEFRLVRRFGYADFKGRLS